MTYVGGSRLLDRYVVREVTTHALAGLAIVLGIFLVTRLSTLLSDAVIGGLSGLVVLRLLALRTLMALPSLLPAVLYIGVLLAISRLSRDREILAMETAGMTPGRLDRAILAFAVAAAVIITGLAFGGRPWAAARFNEVRDRAVADAGLDDVTPGLFYELRSPTNDVVFADARSPTDPAKLEGVFVQRRTSEGITVYSARHAIESRAPDGRSHVLLLEDGVQYDLPPHGARHSITEFEQLAMRRPTVESEAALGPEKTLSAAALANTDEPEARAELQWRIAMPVSAILLCLLAVPLGRTDPRQGRAARVLLAALLYLTYRTLLGTAKSWVADGVLPPAPGLWPVHAACLLTAIGLARTHRAVPR